MTVREFAAFTGMTMAQVRTEIRGGRLMATMIPKSVVDGKAVSAHYEIGEDPAQWLKKRTTPDPEPKKDPEKREKSHLHPQKSQQEPTQETTEENMSPWTIAVSILALGAIGVLFWYELNRSY